MVTWVVYFGVTAREYDHYEFSNEILILSLED
jgi:hypothetical protein